MTEHISKSPLSFFALTFILAFPLWLLNTVLGNIDALKIPVTDLALAFTPMVAAVILTYKESGWRGVKALLKRILDFKRIKQKIWYVPLIFLMPLLYLIIAYFMNLLCNYQITFNHLLTSPVLFILFFILASGEEIGWMGYAFEPLQKRWGALYGSIVLSIPWWIGHFPSILHIGGTSLSLAWWLLGAVSLRIIISWLFNNTSGSIFVAIFFHTMINLGRIISYPSTGSHYDMTYQAVGYIIISFFSLIIILMWDAITLTKESKLRKWLISKF
jgi:uncharacterized protein